MNAAHITLTFESGLKISETVTLAGARDLAKEAIAANSIVNVVVKSGDYDYVWDRGLGWNQQFVAPARRH